MTVETIAQFGVTLAMLVYFVKQNQSDRDMLIKRVTDMEEYIREKLEGALKASNQAVVDNTRVMERVLQALENKDSHL